MLELKNVSIRMKKDGRPLVEGLSFTLDRGEKAVLIGEEGNGKSTLLRLIQDRAGVEAYCDCSGQVVLRGRPAYLPQALDPALYGVRLGEYFDGTEYYLHTDIMEALGLEAEFLFSAQTLGTLSGGEKVKAQLFRLLLTEPDLLLLDEPSNDLDLDTLRWMERFLNRTSLPVLYISHDETLIEHTANVVIHMEQLRRKTACRVTVARLPYRDYLESRRRKLTHQDQVARKQREDHSRQMDRWRQIYQKVEHEQRSISRQDPHGGQLLKKKMRSVLSTGKRLEREREDFVPFAEEETAILARFAEDVRIPAGKTVLDFSLDRLILGDRELARDLRLFVSGPGAVGITGKNGAGKSTLLRRLWEALRQRKDLTAAYMPQDYSEVLNCHLSPLDFLVRGGGKEEITLARSRLGSLRFTPEEMTAPIGELSGGQKAKLLFLDMVLREANVLLLDEPTRNFSPLSAPVVRSALKEFGGAILSVSHDRKYLSEVCDTVYELRQDGLHPVEKV